MKAAVHIQEDSGLEEDGEDEDKVEDGGEEFLLGMP